MGVTTTCGEHRVASIGARMVGELREERPLVVKEKRIEASRVSSGDHSPSLRASPARKARAEGVRVRPGGDQQLQSSGEEPRRYCKL